MNKNYFIFALLTLLISSCGGNNSRSNNSAAAKVDPSTAINEHAGSVTRNTGDRTAIINQTLHQQR